MLFSPYFVDNSGVKILKKLEMQQNPRGFRERDWRGLMQVVACAWQLAEEGNLR